MSRLGGLSPRSVGLNGSDVFIHSLAQFACDLPNVLGFAFQRDDKIYNVVCETGSMTSHPFFPRFLEEGASNGVTFVQNPTVPAGNGRASGVF